MTAWLPISYPGNNWTSNFTYQLEKAQPSFGFHTTSSELCDGTANELTNGKEDWDNQSPFHRTMLLIKNAVFWDVTP
jgi:hypothetical protein